MRRTLLECSLVLLVLATGSPRAAQEEPLPVVEAEPPRIAELAVDRVDGQFVAAFRLDSAFEEEILGKIGSGLETVFEYRLEVIRRRRFWLDERTVQHRILTTTRYDSLSRQYSLLLKVDGEVERSSTTDKPEEMRRWMTEIQGIPLGPVSGFTPAGDFSVRVKSNLQPRFVLLFIPWNRDTAWVRVPLPEEGPDIHGTGK